MPNRTSTVATAGLASALILLLLGGQGSAATKLTKAQCGAKHQTCIDTCAILKLHGACEAGSQACELPRNRARKRHVDAELAEKRHRRHVLRHVGPELAEKRHQRHAAAPQMGPEFAGQGQGHTKRTGRRDLESVAELRRKGNNPQIQRRAAMTLR